MQQKIEAPETFLVTAKVEPNTTAESDPADYDDGLLATSGPIMIASMAAGMCMVALTFLASGEAMFAVVISFAWIVVFFGLPIIMSRMRNRYDGRWCRDVPERRQQLVAVFTGTMKRHEAIAQMIVVPVGIMFAFGSFGLIWVLVRPW